jgi:hypothetical protein
MFTLTEEPDDLGEKITKALGELAAKLRNSDPSTVFAGEQVVCQDNGHLICEIIEDIHYGDLNWTRKLGKWQMPKPIQGSRPVCHVCGGLWWDGTLYIKGRGWVSRWRQHV